MGRKPGAGGGRPEEGRGEPGQATGKGGIRGDGRKAGRKAGRAEAGGRRRKRKRKRGDQYDYDEAFCNDLDRLGAIFIEEMMRNKVGLHYATKTIRSGPVFEVEIYPVFRSAKDMPVPRVRLDNRKAQRDLNSRRARRYLIRLINCNFGEGDFWMTLTYMDSRYPATERRAKKDMGNYIRRVNRLRRRRGMGNAKYIYIMEWEDGADGTRCHFHLLMEGGIGRDELEDMWGHSVVNDTSRLHPGEDGVTGLAMYLVSKKRRRKGVRTWVPSKNLEKPKESVSHSKTGRRQVERMARDHEEIRSYFERDPGWGKYRFVDAEVMYNEFNCAFYVRIKAVERSWGRDGRKGKEGGRGGPACRGTDRGGDDGEPGGGSRHGR